MHSFFRRSLAIISLALICRAKFTDGCNGLSLADTILSANCKYNERVVSATIDLNTCIGHSDEKKNLICGQGLKTNFQCVGCALTPFNVQYPYKLLCECGDGEHGDEINLNDCVAFQSGKLVCIGA